MVENMKFEISNCRNVQDQELLRGVVYFVGMALWGYRKVPTLRHTFSSVLPSFLQVRLKYMYTITYHTCSHVPGILNKHCNLIFFFHFIVDIRINTNKNLIVYLNWLFNYPFIDTIRQAFQKVGLLSNFKQKMKYMYSFLLTWQKSLCFDLTGTAHQQLYRGPRGGAEHTATSP